MRLIYLALFAFIGLPIVLILFTQAGASIFVLGEVQKMSAAMQPDSDPLAERYQITNNSYGEGHYKPSYINLANIDKISNNRTISVTMPIEGILNAYAGIGTVDSALASVFAAKIAAKECQIILEILASACEVRGVTAKQIHEKKGKFDVNFILNFVQKDKLGTIPENTPLVFIEDVIKFEKDSKKFIASDTAGIRKTLNDMYATAGDNCTLIKNKVGSCALDKISIQFDRKKNGNSGVINADAKYAMLVES